MAGDSDHQRRLPWILQQPLGQQLGVARGHPEGSIALQSKAITELQLKAQGQQSLKGLKAAGQPR
jgi:hypothetical protein